MSASDPRQLLPSRRTVPSLDHEVEITLRTHCPAKWAFVDMETGELWGHDGVQFKKLSPSLAADVAHVARQAAR